MINIDKLNKLRLFFSGFLLIIDFFLLPQILTIPLMFKAGTINTWPQTLSIFGGFIALRSIFPLWAWCQLFVLAAILWIWFNGRGFVTTLDGDVPPSAGHGQHGTSRWMKQGEIERVFNIKEM